MALLSFRWGRLRPTLWPRESSVLIGQAWITCPFLGGGGGGGGLLTGTIHKGREWRALPHGQSWVLLLRGDSQGRGWLPCWASTTLWKLRPSPWVPVLWSQVSDRDRTRDIPTHSRTFQNLSHLISQVSRKTEGLSRVRVRKTVTETGRCPRSALRRRRGQEPGQGEEGCAVPVGPGQDLEPRSHKADGLHTNVD